jgi:hypothetical protein
VTRGAYVRLEKLRCAPAGIPACPLPWYAPGVWGGLLSLPIGCWMEGFLMGDVTKRSPILLDRRVRQGAPCYWLFRSTRIWAISGPILTTLNSVYRLTEIIPPAPGPTFAWRN